MLFEAHLQPDTSPVDETCIVQIILYYDEKIVYKFKDLATKAMLDMYPDKLQEANVSDLFYDLLNKYYGTKEVGTKEAS